MLNDLRLGANREFANLRLENEENQGRGRLQRYSDYSMHMPILEEQSLRRNVRQQEPNFTILSANDHYAALTQQRTNAASIPQTMPTGAVQAQRSSFPVANMFGALHNRPRQTPEAAARVESDMLARQAARVNRSYRDATSYPRQSEGGNQYRP